MVHLFRFDNQPVKRKTEKVAKTAISFKPKVITIQFFACPDIFPWCLHAVSNIDKHIETKERASMTGRALENIGVVSWHLGNRVDSDKHFTRAESMYRENKLPDDL